MYLNFLCLVVVFGAVLTIKIYIHSSGDYSARWLVIRYLPFFLIGGIAWLVACITSLILWATNGNPNTPVQERCAALSLPVCLAIVIIT